MLHRLQRSAFLRPRERLLELLVLQQASGEEGVSRRADSTGMLDHRTMAGYLNDLIERGLLEQDGTSDLLQLTETGRSRLHYLLVDFAHELHRLHDGARDILRRSLAPLTLQGARRVAFYPFGETAEVAYSVLDSVDLELVAIADDSPQKWDVRFHGLRIKPPSALHNLPLDAVIVTTTVFQERIVESIRALALKDVRVHLL